MHAYVGTEGGLSLREDARKSVSRVKEKRPVGQRSLRDQPFVFAFGPWQQSSGHPESSETTGSGPDRWQEHGKQFE